MEKNYYNIDLILDGYRKGSNIISGLEADISYIVDQDLFNCEEVYDELLKRFKDEDEESYNILSGDWSEEIEDIYDKANDKFCTFCAYNEYEVRTDLIKDIIDCISKEEAWSIQDAVIAEDYQYEGFEYDTYNYFRYDNKFISREKAYNLMNDKLGYGMFYGERIDDNIYSLLRKIDENLVDYYNEKVFY